MADKPYENREIDTFMREIHATLQRIEEQTTRTNGRVTSLEKDNSWNRGWIKGLAVSISIITLLVIPLSIYAFKISQTNLKLEILNEVK